MDEKDGKRSWVVVNRCSTGSGLFCLHPEFTEIQSNLYPPGKLAGYRDQEIRIPLFHAPIFRLCLNSQVEIAGLPVNLRAFNSWGFGHQNKKTFKDLETFFRMARYPV